MVQVSLINGLQYVGYALELALLMLLLSRKRIGRFQALCSYVAALFVVDAIGRGWVLHHYGASSNAYYYSYWLTDLLLTLGVFLLVCTFFRRACRERSEVWAFVRPTLTFVLVLVAVFSGLALGANYKHLLTRYIFEFNQDLYFTCLVLNTVLYLTIQKFRHENDELSLLVSGLGVQLAGQAAGSAMISLMLNQGAARTVMVYLSPLCFITMMSIWTYAIARNYGDASKGDTKPPRQDPHRRRYISNRDLVSPAMGLKAVSLRGLNRGIKTGSSRLEAYLHG